MARIPRAALPDGFFHVISRGIPAAGYVFRDDADRSKFLALTWTATRRHRWACHAICVLGSHYHLVVAARRPLLSLGMQQLNWHYARYFNAKYESFGHVFADRFTTRVIDDESYLYDACSYVLLNPVRAGLCAEPADWPWSYCSFGLDAF